MQIAVLGATGNVGRPLVALLSERGHRVRAATRSVDKPLPPGATRVKPEHLEELVRGADKMFLLMPPTAAPGFEDEAIAAAAQAGVKHVVKLSSIGASGDKPRGLGVHHLEKEKKLRASGMAWTMLRPGFFMSNALMWLDPIRQTGSARNPYGSGVMYPIAPEDIAAVAALALTGESHEGQIYELTGDVSITGPQEIDIMSRKLGKTVTIVDLSPDEAAADARKRGATETVAALLHDLYTNVQANRVDNHVDTARRLLGRPLLTFEEWFTRFLQARA